MYDLDTVEAILGQHLEQLRALGVTQLYLFGSAVRDQASADSDLDFLVTLSPKTFRNYMNLKFLLEDTFGRSVDLVTRESLKPTMRERVLSEAARVV